MLGRMSSSELAGWLAYEEVEPFGETRADLRAGIIASTMVNLKLKPGSTPLKPSDFMPKFGRREVETPSTLAQKVRAIFGAIKAGAQGKNVDH